MVVERRVKGRGDDSNGEKNARIRPLESRAYERWQVGGARPNDRKKRKKMKQLVAYRNLGTIT